MYQIAMFLLHFDFRKSLYDFFNFLSFRTKPELELNKDITNMEEGQFMNQTMER
jgi:hypothetical protein